jgi:hypothetical protein
MQIINSGAFSEFTFSGPLLTEFVNLGVYVGEIVLQVRMAKLINSSDLPENLPSKSLFVSDHKMHPASIVDSQNRFA